MQKTPDISWYSWPPPAEGPKVRIGVIHTGWMRIFREYLAEGNPSGAVRIPSYAFLLEHPRRRILFDLGLPKFLAAPLRSRLAPLVPAAKLMGILPEMKRGEDTASQLRASGLTPGSIETVIYSHHHFDHTGDIRYFSGAEIVVGPGVLALRESWKRIFKGLNPDDVPRSRNVTEAPLGSGPRLGPFARTCDLLGDGSIYLVDTPGHCTGALGALVRLGSGWVFLAGDAVYIRDNYLRPAPKGVLYGRSADEDREAAWRTVLEIRELSLRAPEVRIWPSHETAVLDGLLPFPEMHG